VNIKVKLLGSYTVPYKNL